MKIKLFLFIAFLAPLAHHMTFSAQEKNEGKYTQEIQNIQEKIDALKKEQAQLNDPESLLSVKIGLLIVVMNDLKELTTKIKEQETKLKNAPEQLKNYNVIGGMLNLTAPRVLLWGTYYPELEKRQKTIVQLEREIDLLRKQ